LVKIKVILGSTRPNRFGPQPAHWLMEQTADVKGAEFELVDLVDVNLPLLDEPVTPMSHQYSKDHTKAWSKIVDDADGFVFVTAEYNHSIPAALKNAIDFLYDEWNYKPVAFVSYGSLAGGSRAVEHLRSVAAEVRMFDLREQIMLPDYYNNLDDDGKFKFWDSHADMARNMLAQVIFWAEKMKPAREELAAQKK
jgi:NAD(P)H-dependent FMN reductase